MAPGTGSRLPHTDVSRRCLFSDSNLPVQMSSSPEVAFSTFPPARGIRLAIAPPQGRRVVHGAPARKRQGARWAHSHRRPVQGRALEHVLQTGRPARDGRLDRLVPWTYFDERPIPGPFRAARQGPRLAPEVFHRHKGGWCFHRRTAGGMLPFSVTLLPFSVTIGEAECTEFARSMRTQGKSWGGCWSTSHHAAGSLTGGLWRSRKG